MDDTQMPLPIDGKSEQDLRRERLGRPVQTRAGYSHRYSRFVRWMRLALPLMALGIITLLFTWSSSKDESVIPSEEEVNVPRSIGKNELLKPRFESTDKKKQPYTITAKRAIQGEASEELIILEKPVADMILNSGNWIAIESDQGAYREDTQRLLLQGNVRLFHDRGYQIETSQLHIDLGQNYAWSEMNIYGQGPAGTLEAKGVKANGENGKLVFTGPAKLVLNRSVKGLK